MSQEPYKNDKRRTLPKFNRNVGENENNSPRKAPRFSFYWVYAIIFAVLIGLQLFGSFNPNAAQITQNDFEAMIRRGEVQDYTIISNRNLVKVLLKKEALSDSARNAIGKTGTTSEGLIATFRIADVAAFKDDMRDFYKSNPQIQKVTERAEAESNW